MSKIKPKQTAGKTKACLSEKDFHISYDNNKAHSNFEAPLWWQSDMPLIFNSKEKRRFVVKQKQKNKFIKEKIEVLKKQNSYLQSKLKSIEERNQSRMKDYETVRSVKEEESELLEIISRMEKSNADLQKMIDDLNTRKRP